MPAKQVAHGVIEISAPAKTAVVDEVASVEAVAVHPVSTGTPPPAVVQHKTAAQIAEEASAVANEAEQLLKDTASGAAS